MPPVEALDALRLLAEVALEARGIGHARRAYRLVVLVSAIARLLHRGGLPALPAHKDLELGLESARVARVTQGKDITARTGLTTNEMKAWRSLGRAMLDIRVLVFNLGRVGYRKNI